MIIVLAIANPETLWRIYFSYLKSCSLVLDFGNSGSQEIKSYSFIEQGRLSLIGLFLH